MYFFYFVRRRETAEEKKKKGREDKESVWRFGGQRVFRKLGRSPTSGFYNS